MKKCEEFLDEILAPDLLSKESETHMAECEECRKLRKTAQSLGKIGSFESSARRARLEKAILTKVDETILGQPAGAEETPVSPGSSLFGGWKMAFAGLFVLFLAILPILRSPVSPPAPGLSEYGLSLDGGPFRMLSMSSPVILEKGKAEIHSPDGSTHGFSGPGKAMVFPRGLEVSSGRMHCSVVPGSETFFVRTPHGSVEVLGTEFDCLVTEEQSRVFVITGRVKVIPLIGTSTTLVANQEFTMLKSSEVPRYRDGVASSLPDHEY